MIVEFTAELWRWKARRDDAWTFVSLPAEESEHIRELTGPQRRGFGSVRVRVTVGTSLWRTSIFPDAASGRYVLPIKKAVRAAEAVDVGDQIRVVVELLDPA
jgi:isopenicillin N synthase-like dioxygenase